MLHGKNARGIVKHVSGNDRDYYCTDQGACTCTNMAKEQGRGIQHTEIEVSGTNVLIACEYSGRVRDAFIRKGHNAVSCDLLKSDSDLGQHMQGDVLAMLEMDLKWDMMIAFPPCTHLAVSGAKWFAEKRVNDLQQKAIEFFLALSNADIPKIAIENPIGIMSGERKYLKKHFPDLYESAKTLPVPQIIQPWQFGHGETKATCLWLKGLPNLVPTDIIEDPLKRRENLTPSGQNKLAPSPDRWKKRSITYQGIANAMADQWS